jgi:hypothetical protein
MSAYLHWRMLAILSLRFAHTDVPFQDRGFLFSWTMRPDPTKTIVRHGGKDIRRYAHDSFRLSATLLFSPLIFPLPSATWFLSPPISIVTVSPILLSCSYSRLVATPLPPIIPRVLGLQSFDPSPRGSHHTCAL